MVHKVIVAAVAAAAVVASVGAASAFPVAAIPAALAPKIEKVTFWGRPFPYGYSWSVVQACTRYVSVATAHGSVTRRVWVCGERWRPGGAVVSYRG